MNNPELVVLGGLLNVNEEGLETTYTTRQRTFRVFLFPVIPW
jgi:hypothetical protein